MSIFKRGRIWHYEFQYRGKRYRANRFMCELAHGPPPSDRHQAAHSCGNSSCVNPNHLRWATHEENERDKMLHGTYYKLHEDDVREIRRMLSKGVPATRIARQFEVGDTTIFNIKSGHTWRNVKISDIKKPASAD